MKKNRCLRLTLAKSVLLTQATEADAYVLATCPGVSVESAAGKAVAVFEERTRAREPHGKTRRTRPWNR